MSTYADDLSARVDASAALPCVNVGMIEPTEIEMPPHAAMQARTAAIAGTRQLVADETLTALLALLIANDVVPAERARDAMLRLSDRLDGHTAGHPEFVVHPLELRMQSERLRRQADELRGES